MNTTEEIIVNLVPLAILVALAYVIYKGIKILYKRSHSNLVSVETPMAFHKFNLYFRFVSCNCKLNTLAAGQLEFR